MGYEEFLRAVLQRGAEQRQDYQRKRRIKAARFPQIKTLDTFDFQWLKNVDKAQVYELATGRFIEEKQPVLMFGNSGTGKTHLATALAYQVCFHAVLHGRSVGDRLGESQPARPAQLPASEVDEGGSAGAG